MLHPKLSLFRIIFRLQIFFSLLSFFIFGGGGCHSAFYSLLLHLQCVSSPAPVLAGFPVRRLANFTVATLVAISSVGFDGPNSWTGFFPGNRINQRKCCIVKMKRFQFPKKKRSQSHPVFFKDENTLNE